MYGCRYALPKLKWLGVASAQLEGADKDVLEPLTPKDRSLIQCAFNHIMLYLYEIVIPYY